MLIEEINKGCNMSLNISQFKVLYFLLKNNNKILINKWIYTPINM